MGNRFGRGKINRAYTTMYYHGYMFNVDIVQNAPEASLHWQIQVLRRTLKFTNPTIHTYTSTSAPTKRTDRPTDDTYKYAAIVKRTLTLTRGCAADEI